MIRIEKIKALTFSFFMIFILCFFMYKVFTSFTMINELDDAHKLSEWKSKYIIYIIIIISYFTFKEHLIQKKSFAIIFVWFLFIQVLLEYLVKYIEVINNLDFIIDIILILIMSLMSLSILFKNSNKILKNFFSIIEFISILVITTFNYLDKLLDITNYQLSFIINMVFILIWVISAVMSIVINKKLYSSHKASSNWLYLIQGDKIITSTTLMATIILTLMNIFTGSKNMNISNFEIIWISIASTITLILIILFITLKNSQIFLIGLSSLLMCLMVFMYIIFYKYNSLLESLMNLKVMYVSLFIMSAIQTPFIKFHMINGNYKIKLLGVVNKIFIILVYTIFGYYLFFGKMELLKMQTLPFDLMIIIAILTLPLINGIIYMVIWVRRSSLIVK